MKDDTTGNILKQAWTNWSSCKSQTQTLDLRNTFVMRLKKHFQLQSSLQEWDSNKCPAVKWDLHFKKFSTSLTLNICFEIWQMILILKCFIAQVPYWETKTRWYLSFVFFASYNLFLFSVYISIIHIEYTENASCIVYMSRCKRGNFFWGTRKSCEYWER